MAIISNATTIADAGAFSVSLGSMVHIKTLTASSSATLSFVHGTADVVLDSTYPIYVFKFINIHAGTDGSRFQFQTDTGTNTSYNITTTSTVFVSHHRENGSDGALEYQSGDDQAQGTSFQDLQAYGSNSADDDHAESGTLTIYNPSSSTFVKHYIARTNYIDQNDYSIDSYVAGYFNTTTALTRFQFKFTSGNIDAGKIKLYGIKDS